MRNVLEHPGTKSALELSNYPSKSINEESIEKLKLLFNNDLNTWLIKNNLDRKQFEEQRVKYESCRKEISEVNTAALESEYKTYINFIEYFLKSAAKFFNS